MNLQMGSNAVIETNLYSYIEPMKWPNKRLAEWHESPALSLDEIGVIQDWLPTRRTGFAACLQADSANLGG